MDERFNAITDIAIAVGVSGVLLATLFPVLSDIGLVISLVASATAATIYFVRHFVVTNSEQEHGERVLEAKVEEVLQVPHKEPTPYGGLFLLYQSGLKDWRPDLSHMRWLIFHTWSRKAFYEQVEEAPDLKAQALVRDWVSVVAGKESVRTAARRIKAKPQIAEKLVYKGIEYSPDTSKIQ